jgi:hypothetical protein
VVCDASPVGLGAVLSQSNPDNNKQNNVIMYLSRLLTEVEKRYSQVEKEALAIVWACERLFLYLFGKEFVLITDNRAVELIFNNPNSNPPLRIRRMALRLMDFNYKIIHKPGAYNIADYFSRNAVESQTSNIEKENESYVAFVTEHAIPRAFTSQEIIEATKKDRVLSLLTKIVTKDENNQESEELKEVKERFAKVIDELTVSTEGLILRGTRIIIPVELQEKAIRIAHDGHQGLAKTKSLLRTKVWFPNMDKRVEELIAKCLACELNDTSSQNQPIKSSKMPDRVWRELVMDFFGPIPNGSELMVIMDEFSRYPVVEEVKSTAAEFVLPKMDTIFSQLGIPIDLGTDNGSPFNGQKFKDFCEYYGIKHRKITPYHPPANGKAENFMKNMGRVIRNAMVEGKDWKQELNQFLRSYRSTPHCTTGVPPSTLMFGENRTNRLPRTVEDLKPIDELIQKVKERDEKMKDRAKVYTDKRRRAKEHQFQIGEEVFMRQERSNKWTTRYGKEKVKIVDIKGSMITIETKEGKRFARDASLFKSTAYESDESDLSAEETTIEENRRQSTRMRKTVNRYNGINRIESGEEML